MTLWQKQPGSFDQSLVEIFQCAAVERAYFAANKEEIRQQLLDLPSVRLGVVFEHDHIEIARGHALENVDLGAFGVDFDDVRLGQDVFRPPLTQPTARRHRRSSLLRNCCGRDKAA